MGKVIEITEWLIDKGFICPDCESDDYAVWWSIDCPTVGRTCLECGYDTEPDFDLETGE